MELGTLDAQAAYELIAEQTGGEVPEPVKSSLLQVSGGNPLALREVVSALRPGELTGEIPLPDPVPIEHTSRVRRRSSPADTDAPSSTWTTCWP